MDSLRLLIRSTNIKTSTKTQDNERKYTLPSAGSSDHAQLFGTGHSKSVQQKKRKREPNLESPRPFAYSVSPELRGRSGSAEKILLGNAGEPQAEYFNEDDEGERRRFLAKHKLRITQVLAPVYGSNPKKPSKKKGKPEKKKTKDKDINRLYPRPLLNFNELQTYWSISRRLFENIKDQGFYEPTEVQMGALPLLLDSSRDLSTNPLSGQANLLTVAPTGSGKTLAYSIPLIDRILKEIHTQKGDQVRIDEDSPEIKAVVIAPTRELVSQIAVEIKKLALGTGVKVTEMQKHMVLTSSVPINGRTSKTNDDDLDEDVIEGSVKSKSASSEAPPTKTDILVSTPLSLINALQLNKEKLVKLAKVTNLVLDEADVLLDPLFRDQTMKLWNACTNGHLRTTLWSATVSSSIESLAKETVTKHCPTNSSPALLRLVVGLKDTAIPNITHKLIYSATEQGKLLAVRQLLHPSSHSTLPALRPPLLIFTSTIPRAAALHAELLYDIPPEAGGSTRIAVLHSSLSATARANTLAAFRRAEIWILVTTDILARGIDFRGINAVVSYDVPNSAAAYIHRVGRTGRAGREGGIAVTLYGTEEMDAVRAVANVIAASEKAAGRDFESRKWLLDALPKVGKEKRKELKRGKGLKGGKISTKSEFERRAEARKKGAIRGSQQRGEVIENDQAGSDLEADEWNGIDD